jgi:hypothetical protein
MQRMGACMQRRGACMQRRGASCSLEVLACSVRCSCSGTFRHVSVPSIKKNKLRKHYPCIFAVYIVVYFNPTLPLKGQ